MTNDQLLWQAATAATECRRLLGSAWGMGHLGAREAAALVQQARRLSAAAEELNRRAREQVSPARQEEGTP